MFTGFPQSVTFQMTVSIYTLENEESQVYYSSRVKQLYLIWNNVKYPINNLDIESKCENYLEKHYMKG